MNTAIYFSFILFLHFGHCDIYTIYDTKTLTSDLGWTVYGNWEEVSTRTSDNKTIRTYQVCYSNDEQDNWIRTPYFQTKGGARVHLEVTYFMQKCNSEQNKCKETFNIFYYESHTDVASSTFPPWKENPYRKIDTVASGFTDDTTINNRTFTISSLTREGMYIALQDQGACMQILTLKLYYYFCPKIVKSLALFPDTMSGSEVTALVDVKGKCVPNAVTTGRDPINYCGGKGRWQILTEGCQCRAGFEPNVGRTACTPCKSGFYKSQTGNNRCQTCPTNSGGAGSYIGLSVCPCEPGYSRAPGESANTACTKPPSEPTNAKLVSLNSTHASIAWDQPSNLGGRTDVFYRISCLECNQLSTCFECRNIKLVIGESKEPVALSTSFKVTKATLVGLKPFSNYQIKVLAMNLVTETSDAKFTLLEFKTKESAPSKVVNIYAAERFSTSVVLKWQPPEATNGVITKYEVEVRSQNEKKGHAQLADLKEVDSGTEIDLSSLAPSSDYAVRIRAYTSAGPGEFSEWYKFATIQEGSEPYHQNGNEPKSNLPVIIGVALGIVLFFMVLVLYFCCKKRLKCPVFAPSKSKNNSSTREPLLGNDHKIYVEYPEPRKAVESMKIEIDRSKLRILEIIGEGEFAVVHRATLDFEGKVEVVAVKQLKQSAVLTDQSNFLREACNMAQFHHKNILALKGVVMRSSPHVIVSEFMSNGSLDEYVKRHKATLTTRDLVIKLQGVASGMKYLSEMKFVHRDLAARNILVSNDGTCKVSDFGLSRILSKTDPYATYTTQGGKIAIRWAAPESIRLRTFTSASDVWSYGILMWEVLSYGEKPYWDMKNESIISNIESGMRLPSPVNCPKSIHDVMIECWSIDDKRRPTFARIIGDLERILNQLHETLATRPSIENELTQGRIASVDDWLNFQKLGNYKERFKKHGIDSLDKVSNLTIKDLQKLGIDVTLNVHKFEHDIRSLRRHLSTSSSRPPSEYSIDGEPFDGEDDVMLPNGHATTSLMNGGPRNVRQYPSIPEGSVAV